MSTALKRTRISFAGESGQGIDSIGSIIINALVSEGYHVFAYREYPSLIKGGFACYQIDVADHAIKSPSSQVDILLSISRVSASVYALKVAKNGIIIHTLDKLEFSAEAAAHIKENNIQVIFVDAEGIAIEHGGNKLMENVVLVGVLWRMLGLGLVSVSKQLEIVFAKKPKLLEIDLECVNAGFAHNIGTLQNDHAMKVEPDVNWQTSIAADGNWAVAKGAVHAGVRAYFAYPMTPSSSVLSYLSDWQYETKMVVKQIEDEISAAQYTIGSSFMGTRAMTGTSGGGFDLMSETVSLAGITETPLVILLAQRPGPGTGLPTWTMAADVNLAVYGGHGEYPRVVLAASDPATAYTLTQLAHNLSEKHRIPVIILTEKQIAEHMYNFASLGEKVPIERHIAKGGKKGEFYHPEAAHSKRWLPGSDSDVYLANSDEHDGAGISIEDAEMSKLQYDRRMGKIPAILQDIPRPRIMGNPHSDTVVIGWGSVENGVHDYIQAAGNPHSLPFQYMHLDCVWPLDSESLKKHLAGKKLIAIENNYTGQVANLITQETGLTIDTRHTKYDGRGFYTEEIAEILEDLV